MTEHSPLMEQLRPGPLPSPEEAGEAAGDRIVKAVRSAREAGQRGTFISGHKTLADMSTVPITAEEAKQMAELAGLNGPFAEVPIVQLQYIYDYLKKLGDLTHHTPQQWIDMTDSERNICSEVNGIADMACLLLSNYLPRPKKVPVE
jgi:hypothetical protein